MNNKGTVCHLTSVHSAFDIRIFHKQCQTLAGAGYGVSLIVSHPKNETADQINILGVSKAKNRFLRMLLLPLKIFWKARQQNADVYHFHDPELLPVGVLLKLFTRGKVIYDAHEDYSKQILYKAYIPAIARKSLAFFIRRLECFCIHFFDAVITATDDILLNFKHHRQAISVRNFPILSNFDQLPPRENKNNHPFKLIYTGGLSPERGISQMIQSLDLLKNEADVELTLCGKFYPNGYEESARKLPGFEKVNYLGWVEMKQAMARLGQSDAGLVCFLPEENHVKALPNKLFEYMAAGLPAITSNFSLWRKIVEANRCGLCVDSENPSEIAEAIRYLQQHPDIRKTMGENGRKAVQKLYRWENEGKKLVDLYGELLARR